MERKEALQRAIEELGRQRAEIARLRQGAREPIAVVGMACRFPGASSVDDFWHLLNRGGDAVTEIPRDRWNPDAYYATDPSAPGKMTTRSGAFVEGIDRFDPQFFGIAPREAQTMDPQQRLLLEVTWEALEHAGIAPADLYGSSTGVFVGVTCFDHAIRVSQTRENLGAYAGTGSALNMAAGRVSYVLGLTGPSMAIDTACSSSLVCLHLACQSLRQHETDAALVGGVHLILSANVMVSFSQARMLAADGRSKTFDASADGYSRGEGCGVIVLKRLADAIAAGDRILGLIRGTAINQDGPSGGLTVPNGAAQQNVIRRALDAAGVAADAVSYVEAHGTGTSLGDPIEVEALANVYGASRAKTNPLLIGSVKTNIGHLEPAAGMAGIIKLLLSFEHGQIPKHLHLRTPNPHIPWSAIPIKVVTEPVSWPRGAAERIGAVSAFGFSGTNGHAIVSEPPVDARPRADHSPDAWRLLPLSARSEAALTMMASRYASLMRDADADFTSIAFTASVGRAHFPYRLAVIARSNDEARQSLERFIAGAADPNLLSGKASNADYRRDAADVKERQARALARLADRHADAREPLAAFAQLHIEGVAIDWRKLYDGGMPARVTLPSYPFQRQRYWLDTPDAVAASSWRSYQSVWVDVGDAVTTDAPATRNPNDIIFEADCVEPSHAEATCGRLLATFRRAMASEGVAPRIWVVTRGAFPVNGAMTAAGPSQATVAAFARVVGLEHPEVFGRVIDLDPASHDTDAAQVMAEMCREDVEDQIAIRSGKRYAQRIEELKPDSPSTLTIRDDAMYLVTGGLGKIGLRVAADLVSRGAKRVCLTARHAATPDQQAAVAALGSGGAAVTVAVADVADRQAMTKLLADLQRQAPLRGVVHAAGVGGYCALAELTDQDVTAVLRPKVTGASILHELTQSAPLDFFVCFSSIASAWGSRGQAHYAAANAFLDALAHLRASAQRPAVAINWGPWAGGGMTSADAATLLGRVGIRALPSSDALAAFAKYAAGSRSNVIVADVDWPLFKGSYEARGHRPLLERLVSGTPQNEAKGGESEQVLKIRAAAPGDRDRLWIDLVQREVAQVLAFASPALAEPGQGLFDMGIDSLMALELRTRLQTHVGRALPATLVFDYPTIRDIARCLASDPAKAPATPAPARRADAPATVLNVDAMSDEDAEALLLKKLESLS